jgi:ADP-ribosylglycohydrolase
MICFLESETFEDAIRNAVSLGGDADTVACIAGAIAEPFYGGVPDDIREESLSRLDDQILSVLMRFGKTHNLPWLGLA